MKYYIVSDVHGFFSEMKKALDEQGFFSDVRPHKLVICGDLLDRGHEPKEVQDFICGLLPDDVILIKGNHEDLLESMLNTWYNEPYFQSHHIHNGTTQTILEMTNYTLQDLDWIPGDIYRAFVKTPFVQKILPQMVNYFETQNYIFTHGWIPCEITQGAASKKYGVVENWRHASDEMWKSARWINGMDAASNGAIVDKTIICGHWHCSYGHHKMNNGEEFGEKAIFTPYYNKGIIAIDACTAYSGKVNCITIDDEVLE